MFELSEKEFKITKIDFLKALTQQDRQHLRLEKYFHQRNGNYKNKSYGNIRKTQSKQQNICRDGISDRLFSGLDTTDESVKLNAGQQKLYKLKY